MFKNLTKQYMEEIVCAVLPLRPVGSLYLLSRLLHLLPHPYRRHHHHHHHRRRRRNDHSNHHHHHCTAY